MWRLVTSGSRTKASLPAELQLQSRYSALGTGSSGKPGEVAIALGKGRAQVHGDVHWNRNEPAESTWLRGRGQNNVGDIMAGICYSPPDRKPALMSGGSLLVGGLRAPVGLHPTWYLLGIQQGWGQASWETSENIKKGFLTQLIDKLARVNEVCLMTFLPMNREELDKYVMVERES